MRLDIVAHVYNHPTNGELLLANAALSTELSNLSTTLSTKDSTIASLSTALAGGDSSSVSAAVDAEDTAVAGEISTVLAS